MRKKVPYSEAFKKFWKFVYKHAPIEHGMMTTREFKRWSFVIWRQSRLAMLEELSARRAK